MVFSSHLFIFWFLPLALGLYYLSPRPVRHLGLTLVSYLFYGWANPLFVVLMFGSTLIDYVCGLVISGGSWREPPPMLERHGSRTRAQKAALATSICSNLSLLAFFKYFNFAADSYAAMLGAIGLPGLSYHPAFAVTLPLGISFYTFQSMSYSIDVYRGDARAIRNFTDFSCYVSLFPQLVAGPIIRFQEVARQLRERTHTLEKFTRGIAFFCLGTAKKILLANACGKVADVCFDANSRGVLDAWYGACAYAFQIYFDFSAYSDMAIGLGLMLGFVFPKNFASPYKSASITEFWRRWHISLSTWLRDYLYIPIGGNRRGSGRTYVNLMTVMVLGGLWHGASWNFVLWGTIHGGMLAFERWQGRDSPYCRLPGPVKIAITFGIVTLAWVFFRAPTLGEAGAYLASMFGLGARTAATPLIDALIYQPFYLGSFAAAAFVAFAAPQVWDFTHRLSWPKLAWIALLFWLSLAMLAAQGFNPFIYFIF